MKSTENFMLIISGRLCDFIKSKFMYNSIYQYLPGNSGQYIAIL